MSSIYDYEREPEAFIPLLDERAETLPCTEPIDDKIHEYTPEDHAFLDSLGETQGD